MPAVLSLRPIKGEKLGSWQTAWLQEKLAKLKEEQTAIEQELAHRNETL
jgi:hypothetical protein